MLYWRLILGTIIISVLVGLCWLDVAAGRPGLYLLPLEALVSLLIAGEMLAMFRRRQHDPTPAAVYGSTSVTVLAAAAPVLWQAYAVENVGWIALGLAVGWLLAVVGEMRRFDAPGEATTNIALCCLAMMYAGGLMGFVIQLRLLGGGPWGDDGRWGMLALISLLATVKMSDIGQYTVGRLFGKHKLAPRISPGKTWEGVCGGLVFATVAAWCVLGWGARLILGQPGAESGAAATSFFRLMIFAVVLAVVGIVGDLAASLLKRDAGVKDSSAWLPGFGGILDLSDSLLAAAPVAYACWVWRLVGP